MKNTHLILCSLLVSASSFAQGTFQNLTFEQASVAPLPSGPGLPGEIVPTTAGLPAWQAWGGTSELSQIFHNQLSIGGVMVDILGPGWPTAQIIGGLYTPVLQAGVGIDSQTLLPAAIAQTGTLPTTAQSLLVKMLVNDANYLSVTLGEQTISMFPLSSGPNYTLYGGNVSIFAGQTRELRFTVSPAPSNPFNSLLLDDITFSDQAIPETSTFGFFVLGALLLGWRWRRKPR